MVRNLVGTLLLVGCGQWSQEAVREVLDARDRRKAGPAAPARGLTLVEVHY
jgi:tRNA pseudouridine38-40 synthase